MTKPVSRAIAMVMGWFLVLNVIARVVRPSLDASIWLIDLRQWNPMAATWMMAFAAAALIAYAIRPRMQAWRCWGTIVLVGGLGAVALVDSIRAVVLSGNGQVELGSAFTFSGLVLMCAVIIASGVGTSRVRHVRLGFPIACAVGGTCMAAFPVAQMATFGLTDYRRPADAILVFGARAYADGRPSDALADRMRTACELYNQGLAARLILSGGPGDGPVHETQAMRRIALEAGIPDSALILDPSGTNTRATVTRAADIAREGGFDRVLAVSHFYHLPRIKLQADRAGLKCFTVPSPQGRPLTRLSYFMAREAAACWAYYLRP